MYLHVKSGISEAHHNRDRHILQLGISLGTSKYSNVFPTIDVWRHAIFSDGNYNGNITFNSRNKKLHVNHM